MTTATSTAELEELRVRFEKQSEIQMTPLADGVREYHGMIGRSALMRRLFESMDAQRDLDIPVLIRGETGTGKELVARAIHELSSRRERPFYCLHCASLPPELFESELFGYEKGAFTGAEEARNGILQHLRGGTLLLLDEITLLPLETQSKLLQVIDSGVVRPLGGLSIQSIDVRFAASTCVDVHEAVENGTFRRDLYFRLAAVEHTLPPLRSRRDDIAILANHFLLLHARRLERRPPGMTPAALEYLTTHSWEGNVRELESFIVRLLVSARSESVLEVDDVKSLLIVPSESSDFPDALLASRTIKDLRRDLDYAYLCWLFREVSGDIKTMTQRLGIQRAQLYAWFQKVGVDIRALRRSLPSDDGENP